MSNEEQIGIDLGVEGKVINQGDETNATPSFTKQEVMTKLQNKLNDCKEVSKNYKAYLNENKEIAKELVDLIAKLKKCLENLNKVEKDYDSVTEQIKNIKSGNENRINELNKESALKKEELEQKIAESDAKHAQELENKKQELDKLNSEHQKAEEVLKQQQEEDKRILAEQSDKEKQEAKTEYEQESKRMKQELIEATEKAKIDGKASSETITKLQQEIEKLNNSHMEAMQKEQERSKKEKEMIETTNKKHEKELQEQFEIQKNELIENNKKALEDLLEKDKKNKAAELILANEKCEKEKQELLNQINQVLADVTGLTVKADEKAKIEIDEIRNVVTETCSQVDRLSNKVKADANSVDSGSSQKKSMADVVQEVTKKNAIEVLTPKNIDLKDINGKELWLFSKEDGYLGTKEIIRLLNGPQAVQSLEGSDILDQETNNYKRTYYLWRQKGTNQEKYITHLYKAYTAVVKQLKQDGTVTDGQENDAKVMLRRWFAQYYKDWISKDKSTNSENEYHQWMKLHFPYWFAQMFQTGGGQKGGAPEFTAKLKIIKQWQNKVKDIGLKSEQSSSISNKQCRKMTCAVDTEKCKNPKKTPCKKLKGCVLGEDKRGVKMCYSSKAFQDKIGVKQLGGKKGGYRYGVKINRKRTLKTKQKTQRLNTLKKSKVRKKKSRKRRKNKKSKKRRR